MSERAMGRWANERWGDGANEREGEGAKGRKGDGAMGNRARSALSRRDLRTQPGVLTPGIDPKKTPTLKGWQMVAPPFNPSTYSPTHNVTPLCRSVGAGSFSRESWG
jgi:hypothetical protein